MLDAQINREHQVLDRATLRKIVPRFDHATFSGDRFEERVYFDETTVP